MVENAGSLAVVLSVCYRISFGAPHPQNANAIRTIVIRIVGVFFIVVSSSKYIQKLRARAFHRLSLLKTYSCVYAVNSNADRLHRIEETASG